MSRDEERGNVLRIIVRDSMQFYNPIDGGAISIGEAKTVWLRAVVDGVSLSFYYSLDGEEFKPAFEGLDCSNLSDEAYCKIGHEGHTGTFIGLTCQDLTGGQNGKTAYCDFEYLEYKEIK